MVWDDGISLEETLHGATGSEGICSENVENKLRQVYTSSKESACLNVLTVVFVFTKGKLLVVITPTLATVSLGRIHRCR